MMCVVCLFVLNILDYLENVYLKGFTNTTLKENYISKKNIQKKN